MARELNKLSALQIKKLRAVEGYHGDGGGLWLQGGPSNGSWIFRYTRGGKTTDMGLGPMHTVNVAEARSKALYCRKLLLEGIDPLEARGAALAQRSLASAKSVTFRESAEAYIKAHRASWKNAKHTAQWEATLATYVYPIFGHLPVQAVDTGLVLKALEAIWTAKPETATRIRARIERVLDWAKVRGYREGENPARWKGHLDKLLATLEKRKRVKHHAALPFNQVGEFLVSVRAQEGVAARALELAILTATRTADVIGARWSEIDIDAAVWMIPASRMKAHREHRVPLTPQAVKLLRAIKASSDSEQVFPLSNMAMLKLLQDADRMNRPDLTVHGFRSTFRDWTAECTNYPREVCEMALAHTIGNATEEAYRRGDLFEKRRQLMNAWAKFCETTKRGEVVPLRKKGKTALAGR